jgi:hypothetical protein
MKKDPGLEPRPISQVGDGASTTLGRRGVAVAGNFGASAIVDLNGLAIVGSDSKAFAHGGVAYGEDRSVTSVGDFSYARVHHHGWASAELNSVALSFFGGWSLTNNGGYAYAVAGLAENHHGGIAAAGVEGDLLGVAIAGACGIALALGEGVCVCCGPGGALMGRWYCGQGAEKLVIRQEGPRDGVIAGKFYCFRNGEFKPVEGADLQALQARINSFRSASGPRVSAI